MKKVVQQLRDILRISMDGNTSTAFSCAIENCIHEMHSTTGDLKSYSAKARQMCFNLKKNEVSEVLCRTIKIHMHFFIYLLYVIYVYYITIMSNCATLHDIILLFYSI